MGKSRTSLKEEAQRAFSRGDWKKALDLFQKVCIQAPEDLRSQLRVAELLERLGQRNNAIQEYRKAAEAYSKEGFLLKAISVCKMILRVDPSNQETKGYLEKLYRERAKEMKSLQPFMQLPLFSELHEREQELLLQHFRVTGYAKNSLIFREGEQGDSLLIIGQGEVSVTKLEAKGKEVPISTLRAGDVLGEFGLLIDQKRHATIKAMTECEILEIPKKELDEITRNHPRIEEVLSKMVKTRVFDTVLALSPLFSPLTSTEREELIGRFHLVKVPGDTLLFRGGDPPSSLYIIKNGEVEIFTQDRKGRRVRLETLKSGDFFGEIGLFLDKPRMAFAQTTRPSELLELTREETGRCFLRYPALQQALKKITSERLGMIKEILSREKAGRMEGGPH